LYLNDCHTLNYDYDKKPSLRSIPPIPNQRSSDLPADSVTGSVGPPTPPGTVSGTHSLQRPGSDGAGGCSDGMGPVSPAPDSGDRSEEHTSELQSRENLV